MRFLLFRSADLINIFLMNIMPANTNLQILIIDDEPAVRYLTIRILQSNNFATVDASSVTEALEILKTTKPDLIITDLMLPGLSGYEFINIAKGNPELKHIPIILMTSHSNPEDIAEGYDKHKVEYYLPKPFNSQQLLAGIRLVLGA